MGFDQVRDSLTNSPNRIALALLILGGFSPLVAEADSIQSISILSPALQPPSGGNGDSTGPIISPDGRFVLFASTADNLWLSTNSLPLAPIFPPKLNVFLRDRINQTTTLVSVNLSGLGGGNDDSTPGAISPDGQYVLFESRASDLLAGDTNKVSDIFIRNLFTGATTLVSVSTNGGSANGASQNAVMTPDGRFVAFSSLASNLVPGDTNVIADVFVRDLNAGMTSLVSPMAIPRRINGFLSPPPDSSDLPQITAAGQFIVFSSTATNLLPGLTNSGEVYIRDTSGGVTIFASTAARGLASSIFGTNDVICYGQCISASNEFIAFEVSPNAAGAPPPPAMVLRYGIQSGLTDVISTNACGLRQFQGDLHSIDMTSDGRFIVFLARTSTSTDTNSQVCLWDAQTGSNTLVSGGVSNAVQPNTFCDWPTIDANGRFVAFFSTATNLTTNSVGGERHLYVRDLVAASTTLVDVCPDGSGSIGVSASLPRLTPNGTFIAFDSADGKLAGGGNSHDYNVFIRELATGRTELISVRNAALPSYTPNGFTSITPLASSTNGHFITFASEADNLIAIDTNGYADVFLCDVSAGTNALVSVATNGVEGANGMSAEASISGDGRYVVFTSSANNLVAGDTNRTQDVFIRDVQSGTTALVSVNTNGTGPGNQASYSPALGADARLVVFRSKATDLAPGSFSSQSENLFLRDLQSGTTFALTTSGVTAAASSPDLRFVAYGAKPTGLYVWDSLAAARIYTNNAGAISITAISGNGQRLAFAAINKVYVADLNVSTNIMLGSLTATSSVAPCLDTTGRWVANVLSTQGTNHVYLYDFQTGTNLLLSQAFNSLTPANDNSDSCAISPDGRFVAYRSFAGNIVPGDTNGLPDLFLFDRIAGTTTLLTVNAFGTGPGNNRSLRPVFSRDSQTIFFQSWASNLQTNDFNHWGDVLGLRLSTSNSVSVFVGQIVLARAGQAPVITWPAVSGRAYRVQFKNSLSDPDWLTVNGNISIVGSQGYLTDLTPNANQRFYRIMSF